MKRMYKIWIVNLVLIVLTSCETTVKKEYTEDLYFGTPISILTIDSCEYIHIPNGNASWGAHKGNCKYCLKRNCK